MSPSPEAAAPAAALSAPAGAALSPEPFVRRTRDFGVLPIPRRRQYDPDKPFEFNLLLNSVMAAAATFVVANLYVNQPVSACIRTRFEAAKRRLQCLYHSLTSVS